MPLPQKVTWVLLGFLAMHFVFQSLVRLVIAISLLGQEEYLFGTIIELVNLTLAGWVFFTYFAPVSAVGMIREPNTQEEPEVLNRVMLVIFFVISIRLAFFSLPYVIKGVSRLPVWGLPTYYSFIAFCFLGLTFGLPILNYHYEGRKHKTQSFNELFDQSSESSPFIVAKLKKNLSEDQLEEMARLLYESKKLQEVSVREIARFLWLTIFLSLVVDVLFELVSRVFV